MKITQIILHHKNQRFWAGLSLKYVAISGARSLQITRYRPDTSAELWSGRHLQDPVKKNDFSRKVTKTYKISPFPSHLHLAKYLTSFRNAHKTISSGRLAPPGGCFVWQYHTFGAFRSSCGKCYYLHDFPVSIYPAPCWSKTLMKSHFFIHKSDLFWDLINLENLACRPSPAISGQFPAISDQIRTDPARSSSFAMFWG